MSNENFVRTTYGRPDDLILIPKKNDLVKPLLRKLLGLCTPNGSEHHIVDVIRNLPYVKTHKRLVDRKLGNYIIQVGESRSIFSCHMDIVGSNHKDILAQNKVEKIFLLTQEESSKNVYGMIWGAKAQVDKHDTPIKFVPSTLGADDKVGVYILLRMIEENIPGTYVFHTGEECGGLGSSFLASSYKELFENKDRAIAFDRAGYKDVIGFQRGGRCCSTEFGAALATALNTSMPPASKFKEDAHGTFTDTANYMRLVPECTNVSVGYFNQHGSGEHLDVYWLEEWLIPAILKIDYEALPTKRDPKEVAKSWSSSSNYGGNTAKKEWKDATVKTPYIEFPLWNPDLGIPEGANRDVLVIAMSRYISNLSYGKEKDAFCNWVIEKLAWINLIEEENTSLNAALAMVNGPPKANPPDVILLPPPADYKKSGEFIDLRDSTKIDFDFEEKVSLLTRLVVLSEKGIILKSADDQQMLNYYTIGAKKILDNLGDKTSFSEKKANKVNRIIFTMARLIDDATVLLAEEEKVLDDVLMYMGKQEKWWDDYRPTVH